MKQYQGEKAIISLTSWKARIKTVGLTIYSLLKNCPGFHIVLCLSEEEFPAKEAELPDDINLLANCNKIEILWVRKNYKAFKKILFTMDKYRDVPIISADDDCLYICNYADDLYAHYVNDPKCIYTINAHRTTGFQHGPATIYPPYAFIHLGLELLQYDDIVNTNHDDVYYGCLAYFNSIKIICIHDTVPYVFHDTIIPLSKQNRCASINYSIRKMYEILQRHFTDNR